LREFIEMYPKIFIKISKEFIIKNIIKKKISYITVLYDKYVHVVNISYKSLCKREVKFL